MKKVFLISISLVLIALLSSMIYSFPGSARSQCSSLFVSCHATCTETYLYSRTGCSNSQLFPDCHCDGLLKRQEKSIWAKADQQKNLKNYIHYLEGLNILHKKDLLTSLNEIQEAIIANDYPAYENAVKYYQLWISKISKQQKEVLEKWRARHRE